MVEFRPLTLACSVEPNETHRPVLVRQRLLKEFMSSGELMLAAAGKSAISSDGSGL